MLKGKKGRERERSRNVPTITGLPLGVPVGQPFVQWENGHSTEKWLSQATLKSTQEVGESHFEEQVQPLERKGITSFVHLDRDPRDRWSTPAEQGQA